MIVPSVPDAGSDRDPDAGADRVPAAGADREPRTRLRLDLAYDGSRFSGWSAQPGLRTVQGELEAALAIITRSAPRLTVAGRTDAGVHATGQVAHVDLTERELARARGVGSLARRLNGIAGREGDIWVAAAEIAPPGFDARFSPIWRRYEYRIADPASAHDPRRASSTLWHPAPLDASAMDAAARELCGLHDWAAYCKPREGATAVRTLQEFRWVRDDEGVLLAGVRADAFCHSMVRALVGGSIAVGEGRLPERRLSEVRDARVRGSDFAVAPAKGLTLVEVGYPQEAELAARAEQTRARRDPL